MERRLTPHLSIDPNGGLRVKRAVQSMGSKREKTNGASAAGHRGRKARPTKRGPVGGFGREMPVALAAVVLGIVYLIGSAFVPDGEARAGYLGIGGPVVLLVVIVAVAVDLFRKWRRLARQARKSQLQADRFRQALKQRWLMEY